MGWITEPHRLALRSMQDEALQILRRQLCGIRECALLDFPDHANVGDSMIWLGELKLLEALGIAIKYSCNSYNYEPRLLERALGPDGAILIHGGGNFGTLYVRHQQLRERALADFPTRRMIQLPQSINFQPGEVLERTQRLVQAHTNLTLLVRDTASRAFAAAHFDCDVEICPDMALMLGSLQQARTPTVDYFLLARTDKERAADWAAALARLEPTAYRNADWLAASRTELLLSRATGLSRRLLGDLQVISGLRQAAYAQNAAARLRRGMRTLGQGRVVLTDRLHAHVLCVLMGKPHVVVGDAHGKIRGFFEAYSSKLSAAAWADDPDSAFAAARQLLEAQITEPGLRASPLPSQ
jgi:exopolysaccharide biosynthesis predicted pyruvyltransferase EpsI